MFSEEYQVDFLQEYHKVFDNARKNYLVGEMVWNFADFMTVQGKMIWPIFYLFEVEEEFGIYFEALSESCLERYLRIQFSKAIFPIENQ